MSIDPDLMLRIIREERHPIAYDTETDGLHVTAIPVGYVVANEELSLYTPVAHSGGGNIPDREGFEKALAGAFADRSRLGHRTVGHHLGFDLRASLRRGIVLWSPLEDTSINEALIDDRTYDYSLDASAKRHGVAPKMGADLYAYLADKFGGLPNRNQMEHFHKLSGDDPMAVEYATGDGITTLELWAAQQTAIDRIDAKAAAEHEAAGLDPATAPKLRVPWQLECDLLPYMARIHHRGLKVDLERKAELMDPTNEESVAYQISKMKEKYVPGFNVRSADQVEKLFRAHGYTDSMFQYTAPTKSKPNGQASFTEKWLETNEIGVELLDLRQMENAVSKFLTPMTETHVVNGRLHPVLHQSKTDDYGVKGARLSCSDPNLQAVTKRKKKLGKIIRSVIIPDDGMTLYEADFSQQEPRLFTHYSEEPSLVEGYRNGTVDIHDRANELLFESQDREKAKRMAMGMLSMMYPPTLAVHMGWDLGRAKRAHRAFLGDAFPHIGQFQQDVVAVFRNRGFVRSILGRIARLEHVKYAYQGVSRVIQNSGGDHMKMALLLACQFEDAHPDLLQLLLTIHDSLVFQSPDGVRKEIVDMIRAIEDMATKPPLSVIVPLPMELTGGKDWAEASYSDKIKSIKGGWVEGWREYAV